MKRISRSSLFALLLVCGCGRAPFQIALQREGKEQGIEERYAIRSDDSAFKFTTLPGNELKVVKRGLLGHTIVDSLGTFLRTHSVELDSLSLPGNGKFLSSIIFKIGGHEKVIRWTNLDPPPLQTPILDSLYQKMLIIEARISQFPD